MKVKKIKSSKILSKVIYTCLCCAFGWYLHGKMVPVQSNLQGQETPYVLVETLTEKNISSKKKYIAQIEAINSVDIIPQVSGYLEEILFKDGSYVNEGDKIFMIEQRKYKADLMAAEAKVWQLKKEHERMLKLHKSGDVTDKQYDVSKSSLLQAEASLDLAKLNLEHSEIKSPISGYIGKALVTKGNLVSPNAQKLARIVQMNPIRVAFSVTDMERFRFLEKTKQSKDAFVDIVLPSGDIKTVNAKELFTGNEINSQTATIPVYVDVENENHMMVPGNYVDIFIRFDMGKNSLLVPQLALCADVHGTYVMMVDNNNIVHQKYVTLGDVFEDKQVVLSGLEPTDKVVVQGLQKVRNGMMVNPTLVSKNQ